MPSHLWKKKGKKLARWRSKTMGIWLHWIFLCRSTRNKIVYAGKRVKSRLNPGRLFSPPSCFQKRVFGRVSSSPAPPLVPQRRPKGVWSSARTPVVQGAASQSRMCPWRCLSGAVTAVTHPRWLRRGRLSRAERQTLQLHAHQDHPRFCFFWSGEAGACFYLWGFVHPLGDQSPKSQF